MKRWVVFKAVLAKSLIEQRRYLFNMVSGLVTMYIVFLLLFFGARMIGGSVLNTGGSLEGLVVGYTVWMLAIVAFEGPAWGISQEADVGTLEQLHLSPAGFTWVQASSMASGLLVNLGFVAVVLALMMATTGRWLNLDLLSLLPLALVTIAAPYGFGFLMAGLALVFKRIQNAFQILTFSFVACVIVPAGKYAWVKFLPLAMGNSLLRRVMVDGVRLWRLPAADLALATAVSVAYLLAGILVFGYCLRVARDKGLMGHY